jgi:branched-chain amino acid transport system permease protein
VIGGALYWFLEYRLPDWTGSQRVQDLPEVIRVPLSEPLFVLGTLFILLVFFVPGGIAGLVSLRPRRGIRALEQTLRREEAETKGVEVGA